MRPIRFGRVTSKIIDRVDEFGSRCAGETEVVANLVEAHEGVQTIEARGGV